MTIPIFVFSLPRSGSTLLQRILMTNKNIKSVAEPWILLPLIYSYKKEGVLSEYSHKISHSAVSDFIENLPNQYTDFHSLLREFVLSLYTIQCTKNEKYFLDKTPRYYNIIPEIMELFPEGKFIFLFRNPVHIMSSMIETWSSGNLRRLYAYDRDLNYGMTALSEAYKKHTQISCSINYEDLLNNPEANIRKICLYLNIDYDENMILDFSLQKPKGNEGDPIGTQIYNKIEKKTILKWKNTFNSYYRKRLVYNYVSHFDDHILKIQGYDKEDILEEISTIETRRIGMFDTLDHLFSTIVKFLKLNIWFLKHTSYWAKNRFLS